MSKLFQIYEDDLAELERTLPDVLSHIYPHLDNRLRVQFRRLQTIVQNVRWNYGPPSQVELLGGTDG
jgi:hypothetical protein